MANAKLGKGAVKSNQGKYLVRKDQTVSAKMASVGGPTWDDSGMEDDENVTNRRPKKQKKSSPL